MLKKSRFQTKLSLLLIVFYTLSILNVFFPVIRFRSRAYNLWFTIGFMMVPFLLYAIGFGYKHWYTKVVGAIVYGMIALFSGIVIVFVLYGLAHMTSDNYDPSFMVMGSYYYKDSRVVVYKVNGGAISSFGTKVRQEKEFLKGLMFVKDIFVIREDSDVEVIFKPDRIIIDNRDYTVKKNIFF